MSTKWYPASTPPLSLQSVMLRFGDSGERDTRGFFVLARGSYYASADGFFSGAGGLSHTLVRDRGGDAVNTTWRPYTDPPQAFKNVWLRFGDDGERDAIGIYDGLGAYYKSLAAMHRHESVHPTHWKPICSEARKDA